MAVLVASLMMDGFLRDHPQHTLPKLSYAAEVRSALAEAGETLEVVVSCASTLSAPEGRPDSVLIRVTPGRGRGAVLATQTPNQLSDTVYLPVPQRGETLAGLSCVATEHNGYPVDESCTPWQYVRPTASAAETVNQI